MNFLNVFLYIQNQIFDAIPFKIQIFKMETRVVVVVKCNALSTSYPDRPLEKNLFYFSGNLKNKTSYCYICPTLYIELMILPLRLCFSMTQTTPRTIVPQRSQPSFTKFATWMIHLWDWEFCGNRRKAVSVSTCQNRF